MKDVGFSTCSNKGFHIRFPSGLTLSTQFGSGNYGSNYNFPIGKETEKRGMDATTVEIAVFATDGGEWKTRETAKLAGLDDPGDDVMGYVDFPTWLRMFNACQQTP